MKSAGQFTGQQKMPFMSQKKTDNIFIADSQFLVVETLKRLISEQEAFELRGIAGTKSDLLQMLGRYGTGLLLTDIATMDYDGLADLKRIREEYPGISILVLTNYIGKMEFLSLTKYGIRNILYKNAGRDELFSAIRATLKGRKFYSPEIMYMYLDGSSVKSPGDESGQLTASEIEIVRLIANGLTTKEIADRRNVSVHTVSTHRKNIFRKIEVSSASELIMHAIKAGWIDNIEYYI